MKIQRKNLKFFNKNPIFGGPKYGNEVLKKYEEERNSSLSKNSVSSTQEEPIPIKTKFEDNGPKIGVQQSRVKTKRFYVNRYANLSDFNLDWAENLGRNYQHPLGKNHTALDSFLRERTRNQMAQSQFSQGRQEVLNKSQGHLDSLSQHSLGKV